MKYLVVIPLILFNILSNSRAFCVASYGATAPTGLPGNDPSRATAGFTAATKSSSQLAKYDQSERTYSTSLQTSSLDMVIHAEKTIFEDNVDAPEVPHATKASLPNIKSLTSRLSFSWARPMMDLGNRKPLDLADLWTLDSKQQMHNASSVFHRYFANEKEIEGKRMVGSDRNMNIAASNVKKSKPYGILQEFWSSPITRAIIWM